LAEVAGEELVIGVAGRFWRPDGGRRLDLAASDFVEFSRSGYAKAVWNFKLRADSSETTNLSAETRIKCFGKAASWKFRLCWRLVGPFSGLLRKAILKPVKLASESTVKEFFESDLSVAFALMACSPAPKSSSTKSWWAMISAGRSGRHSGYSESSSAAACLPLEGQLLLSSSS
jgi:hypothetical protein